MYYDIYFAFEKTESLMVLCFNMFVNLLPTTPTTEPPSSKPTQTAKSYSLKMKYCCHCGATKTNKSCSGGADKGKDKDENNDYFWLEKELAGTLSCHGLSYVVREKRFLLKLFWGCIVFGKCRLTFF